MNGDPLTVPGWTRRVDQDGTLHIDGWQALVPDLQARVKMWQASQIPVALLRYPRAVDRTQHRLSLGGHAWFQRYALPRMVGEKGPEAREPGLKPLYIDGA